LYRIKFWNLFIRKGCGSVPVAVSVRAIASRRKKIGWE
jgi:hypothetical protein